MTLQLPRGAGAGHLVSITPDGLDATFVPFLVDDELTTVHAHLARVNPHWRELDGADVLLAALVLDLLATAGSGLLAQILVPGDAPP